MGARGGGLGLPGIRAESLFTAAGRKVELVCGPRCRFRCTPGAVWRLWKVFSADFYFLSDAGKSATVIGKQRNDGTRGRSQWLLCQFSQLLEGRRKSPVGGAVSLHLTRPSSHGFLFSFF